MNISLWPTLIAQTIPTVVSSVIMARMLFVNPPVGRYDEAEIAPPLSLLALASAAAEQGHAPHIIDLNLPEHRAHADDHSFYEYATNLIAAASCSHVFMTSMGVNTHVAVQLASIVTAQLNTPVHIGGVHASSVATRLRSYLPSGVTVADRFEPLPFGARSLFPSAVTSALSSTLDVSSYFLANNRRVANLEAGRGCKYRCGFCYSPTVHSKWTTYDVADVADSFADLAQSGFRHAFLVDDNLTNSPVWFAQLCEALSRTSSLTWNGYATLLDLTPELITLAAAAGCTNLYLGIDAVAPTQQREWNKTFYKNSARLNTLLQAASSTKSLQLTCAFILDLSPLADQTTELTLRAAVNAAALGADIRLSVMTPYAGTAVAAKHPDVEYAADRPAILFDLPAIAVTNDLATRAPELFPWHARPALIDSATWRHRLLAVHAAQVLLENAHSLLTVLPSGYGLWRHCLSIASKELLCTSVHKTELRTLVRDIHAAIAA